MAKNFPTMLEISNWLFDWLLRRSPKAFQDQLGEDMRITFHDICEVQAEAAGNIGLAKELLSTIWDMGKAILFLHVWLIINIGNKRILSLTSTALMLAGVTYISPICPLYLTGGIYVPDREVGIH